MRRRQTDSRIKDPYDREKQTEEAHDKVHTEDLDWLRQLSDDSSS